MSNNNKDQADEILRRLFRGSDDNDRRNAKGTFLLEASPLGRTFIYDVAEEDGDLFYTPDPCNPDAPAIPPRSCTRPPPTYAELTASETPTAAPPPPAPPKNPQIANHKEGPAGAPAPAFRKRGRPRKPPPDPNVPVPPKPKRPKPSSLIRAGIDPTQKATTLPVGPTAPVQPIRYTKTDRLQRRSKRRGSYGIKAMCDDGTLRNMSEVMDMTLQTNELLPPAERLADEEIAARMNSMFPWKDTDARRVAQYRASYNRGALSCQDGTRPPIRSRRYDTDPSHPDRIVVLNCLGRPIGWLAKDDPPDAPPRFNHRPGVKPQHTKYFEEWQREQAVRVQLLKARHREAMRQRKEQLHLDREAAPPPAPGAPEAEDDPPGIYAPDETDEPLPPSDPVPSRTRRRRKRGDE